MKPKAKGLSCALAARAAIALVLAAAGPAPDAWARPAFPSTIREIGRLDQAALGDDRAEDRLASLISRMRWPVPRAIRVHDRWTLRVDPQILAVLDLGPAGARDPLDLRDARLAAAAVRVGQDAPPRALPALRVCTRSPDAALRAQAALAIGWARDPGGEPFVRLLTADPIPAVRVRAMQALGQMDDPSAIAPLTRALADRVLEVELAAIAALGTLGDPAAWPAIDQEAGSSDRSTRLAADEAGAELGGRPSAKLFERALADPALWQSESGMQALYALASAAGQASDAPFLAQMAKEERDPDPVVRRAAAVALGASRDPLAVPTLLAALSDADDQVRGLAAQGLGKIGDPSAAPALVDAMSRGTALLAGQDRAGPALVAIGAYSQVRRLQALAVSVDPRIAACALETLGELGDAADVPRVLKALARPDEGVRVAAVDALADLARLPAARAQEEACGPWGRAGVLTDADMAELKARKAPDCGLSALMGAVLDPLAQVRAAAAHALGILGDPRAFGQLFLAAGDPDPSVAQAARVALGRSKVPWAEEPLAAEASRGSTGAAVGLAELGGGRSVGRIATLLTEGDPDRRGQAVEALAAVMARRSARSATAIGPLIRALEDPDRAVRIQAALALSATSDRQALGALHAAWSQANPHVRPWFAAAIARRGSGPLVHAAWATLRAAASDGDPSLRLAGLEALAWLGEPQGVVLAEPSLSARWPAVRRAAVDVLVRTPGEESARVLEGLVTHGHWSEAVRALDDLGPGDPRSRVLVDASLTARDHRVRWAAQRLVQRSSRMSLASR